VSEPVDLAYLVFHRSGPDGAYTINMRHRRYEAIRRDDGTVLTADSAEELLDLIRADYAERPVSRRIARADRPQTPSCRFRPEG
jgi:hypothetical protein